MLLSEQFNACIIAYDEGITGDDKILAAALWRRFLQSEGNDPEKLEKLVHYVRKQVRDFIIIYRCFRFWRHYNFKKL